MVTRAIAILGALSALGAAACTEAKLPCRVGPGPSRDGGGYAAMFHVVDTSAKGCATLPGDVLGLELDALDASAVAPVPATLSIGSLRLARRAAAAAAAGPAFVDERHAPLAVGALDRDTPDDHGVCTVSAMSLLEQDFPALPDTPDLGGTRRPGLPALHARYAFHDVRILVTETTPGTALRAALDVEDVGAGCKATYDVLAVWPAVSAYTFDLGTCEALGLARDGTYSPLVDAHGDALPDPALCRAEPHPDEHGTFAGVAGASYALGSGLDPSLDVTCANLGPSAKPSDALFACVLASPPDGLR